MTEILHVRGLTIEIFKWKGQSASNLGVTDGWDEAVVIGPGLPEIDDIRHGVYGPSHLPVLQLVRNRAAAKLVPLHLLQERRWTMFGGCFGWTTDSRFREAVRRITDSEVDFPVPIHDRVEG